MIDKDIVQQIAAMGKGLIHKLAKACITECDREEYINILVDQYRDAPIGLKKIIGGKLFQEIKFRYERK